MMLMTGLDPARIAKFSDEQLGSLLRVNGGEQQQLFALARERRRMAGRDKVLLRGVIEVSNNCQKKCDYCAMNCRGSIPRYRMEAGMILDIARHIRDMGITTVFIQSGQDPLCRPIMEEVIPAIRDEMGAEVLLCIGEKPRGEYQRYFDLGARAYILKFETSDSALYNRVAHGSLEARLQCFRDLKEIGYHVGTGNIIGLPGQTFQTMLDDIRLAMKLDPHFVSSAPFIPNQGTSYEEYPCGDLNYTLNTMAIWRIALGGDRLIPTVSALEKLRQDGQLMGLQAGANVMTINFTPNDCRKNYAIYTKQRFIVSLEHALRTIERAGLEPIMDRRSVAA